MTVSASDPGSILAECNPNREEDRNGKYLHERGGSHRLSMAKILNMPLVPVVIIRKHFKTYVKENNYNDNPF